MHFKLLIAFVEDSKTDKVMDAARQAGATGATVINNARGYHWKHNAMSFCFWLSSISAGVSWKRYARSVNSNLHRVAVLQSR